MPQNQTTGAAGNDYGRETAPRIATAISATMLGTRSNEATYEGQRVVIKCARAATTSVGVTYEMLKGLDLVIAAFQHKDGSYDVYSMPAREYETLMTDSRSSGGVGGWGSSPASNSWRTGSAFAS